MKVFLSSVIAGFEEFRDAAAEAVQTLGHEVTRAEDFGAAAEAPQAMCLEGVRQADMVLLLLGGRYGGRLASGRSATHEEYLEARLGRPVLVFVQSGVEAEPAQLELLREVQDWAGGLYTSSFAGAQDLKRAVTRQVHLAELDAARGGLNEEDLVQRASALLKDSRSGSGEPALVLAVAGGPHTQLLRPGALSDAALSRELKKAAQYDFGILDENGETRLRISDDRLVIEQDGASVVLNEAGSVRISQPAIQRRDGRGFELPAFIEEDVQARLLEALRFASWVYDRLDSASRLRYVVPIGAILHGGYWAWRTRAEHSRNPGSGQMRSTGDESVVVTLTPPGQPRSALRQKASEWAEDLVVLLKRRMN